MGVSTRKMEGIKGGEGEGDRGHRECSRVDLVLMRGWMRMTVGTAPFGNSIGTER